MKKIDAFACREFVSQVQQHLAAMAGPGKLFGHFLLVNLYGSRYADCCTITRRRAL